MILGITAQNHDASMALIDGPDILWAGHSERYSRKKNDNLLNADIIRDLNRYGEPTSIVWFEKPIQKSLRRLWAGQKPWYDDVMNSNAASWYSKKNGIIPKIEGIGGSAEELVGLAKYAL